MNWDEFPTSPPPKPERPPLHLSGISASDLAAKRFNPIRYIVPGYIAEGATLLAGAPKIGKSWMALGLALAVAGGRPAFGTIASEYGDVLYLALEDNERRLKKRLLHMNQGTPESLTFMTQWPSMDAGAIDHLEAWVASVERPRLIVVDVLTKVRGTARNGESAYEADYRALTGLQGLAGRHGLAVIIVHHTRKMEADDPFDSVSGTRGLTGAADSVLVLKRDIGTGQGGRVTLYGRGRDIEEIETAFEFNRDNGTWRVVGAAHEVARSCERQTILDCLRSAANPMNAREISDLIGKPYEAIRKTLTRMAHAGEVEKTGRGMYACPNGPIVPDDPFTANAWDIGTHGTGDILWDDSSEVHA